MTQKLSRGIFTVCKIYLEKNEQKDRLLYRLPGKRYQVTRATRKPTLQVRPEIIMNYKKKKGESFLRYASGLCQKILKTLLPMQRAQVSASQETRIPHTPTKSSHTATKDPTCHNKNKLKSKKS